MMHLFQISISPILFLVVRWQTFSNCLSDYVRIVYLFYMICILFRMSIGYLESLVYYVHEHTFESTISFAVF